MMKQIVLKIICAIILILTTYTYAKNNWFLKAGANYSTLQNVDDTKGKFGYSIGFEKAWRISPVFCFASGIHYNTKEGIIKNATVGNGDPSIPVYKEDIYVYLHYISVPLFIKCTQKINENLSLNIFFGPSIESMKKDNSKGKNILKIYDPDVYPNEYVHPDFYFADDFVSNSGSTFNIGIGIEISNFVLDYFYSNGLPIKIIRDVIIDKDMQTHFVRFGIKI